MATPHLKTTSSAPAPRKLLHTGATPASRVRLLGANGQAIQPKKPLTAPPAAKPTPPAPDQTEDSDKAVAARQAEAAAQQQAEEARKKAEAEAAQKQAEEEAEAARLAQEEYERQLEEYNRQLEEYNRQMAALKAEEEARAAAEAKAAAEAAAAAVAAEKAAAALSPAEATSAPAASAKASPAKAAAKPSLKPAGVRLTPSSKPSAAKPAAAKPATAKPATTKASAGTLAAKPSAHKAPTAAPSPEAKAAPEAADASASTHTASRELSEEELAARDAYLAKLQAAAAKPPVWKRLPFWLFVGGLLIIAGVCGSIVVQSRAEAEAKLKHQDYVNKLLRRAQDINQKGIETMDDARSKNVDIVCSKSDADCLLEVVVDPFIKDEKGHNVYGGNPEGVAQLACLLLGLASEQDPSIDKQIFSTLSRDCTRIKPTLYRWLIQRMAVSNNKGINSKFKKLADSVAKKKWNKRAEVLSYIWEAMGLRVTEKDIPAIVELLGDPDIDGRLANTLASCLDNILLLMDDEEKKREVGDKIFEVLPEKYRSSLMGSLASACSPKALAFYKERAKNPKNWKTDKAFFGNYGSDDIIPYLQELKASAAGDEKAIKHIDDAIRSVVGLDRERTDEEAAKLLSLVFDKIQMDTSDWQMIINKTDPDAADFVGENSPEYQSLMERRKELEECRQQKLMLIHTLGRMHDRAWVVNLLEKYKKDTDADISIAAKEAREKVTQNTAADKSMKAKYKSRDKN